MLLALVRLLKTP